MTTTPTNPTISLSGGTGSSDIAELSRQLSQAISDNSKNPMGQLQSMKYFCASKFRESKEFPGKRLEPDVMGDSNPIEIAKEVVKGAEKTNSSLSEESVIREK